MSPRRRGFLDVLFDRWSLDHSPVFVAIRLNEASFNAVLLKESRIIALLRQVADPGDTDGALWAGMRIHRVPSDLMVNLGYSSKLNAEWDFLCMLRDRASRFTIVLRGARRGFGPTLLLRSRRAAECEKMTLFGILLGFALLIWLAYRGWSIMVLAPPERRIIFGVAVGKTLRLR